MNGNMILLLSLLHVAAIVTVGQGSCPQDCFGGLSLYKQYCCNISNYGETVRVTEEDRHHTILCPTNRPTQCLPASCSDVVRLGGTTPGYFDIMLTNGSIASVFCGCDGEDGWTRVAYLNMSDPLQQCPTELRLYNESGVRACGRRTSGGDSCDSVTFSINGASYSQVCGRVIGYQYGHTDAIHSALSYSYSIDSPYVDGISITHGSLHQHIWTLAAGYIETGADTWHCPCNTGSPISVPSFIGNDYFCESGTLAYDGIKLYRNDPLWDGEGCGGNEGPCCNAPGIPWFHKVLNSSTTDDIELRMCSNHNTTAAPLHTTGTTANALSSTSTIRAASSSTPISTISNPLPSTTSTSAAINALTTSAATDASSSTVTSAISNPLPSFTSPTADTTSTSAAINALTTSAATDASSSTVTSAISNPLPSFTSPTADTTSTSAAINELTTSAATDGTVTSTISNPLPSPTDTTSTSAAINALTTSAATDASSSTVTSTISTTTTAASSSVHNTYNEDTPVGLYELYIK